MNALRKPIEIPVPAFDIFRERCEAKAKAILVEACLLGPHDAVDDLQAAAIASGLVDGIGQDAVQRMMADAFAIVQQAEPPSARAMFDSVRPDPAIRTAAALRDKIFEPIKYIVPNYITEGCTILAGRPTEAGQIVAHARR